MTNTDPLALQRRDSNYELFKGLGVNIFDLCWTPTLTDPPTVPSTNTIAFTSYHANYLKNAGVKFVRITLDPTFYWIANQPGVDPYASTPGLKAMTYQWIQTCVTAGLPVFIHFRDRAASVAQPNVPTAPFNMAVMVSDEFLNSFGQWVQGFASDMAAISQTMIIIGTLQEPSAQQYIQQGVICSNIHMISPLSTSGTLSIKLTGLTKLDVSLSSGMTTSQIATTINSAIAASGTYAGKVNAAIMLNRLLITGTNSTNQLESITPSTALLGRQLGIRLDNGAVAITYTKGYGVPRFQPSVIRRWNFVQKTIISYIRAGAPLNTIVVTGYDFGTIEARLRWGLPTSGDPNVFYDMAHLYEPIISQQGQTGSNQYLYQCPYPVTAPSIQTTTDTITRSTTGQVDPIDPAKTPLYLPGATTVSISGYTYGTDYTVTNNSVVWVSGHGPATGATYVLNFQYYNHSWLNNTIAKLPVKVVDTSFIRGAGSSDTINAAYGTLLASVPNAAPNGIQSIKQGATTYVEGVDWTLSGGNTINWIGSAPATSSTYTVTLLVNRSKANQIYQLNNSANVTFTPSITSVASTLTIAQTYASTGYSSANLFARIKLVADIALRNNVKVMFGEFGMPKQSDNATPIRTFCDQASNVRYYQDFVSKCAELGIAVCFWEMRSGAWGCFSLSGNDNGSAVSGYPNSDLRQTWVADALGFTGTNPI